MIAGCWEFRGARYLSPLAELHEAHQPDPTLMLYDNGRARRYRPRCRFGGHGGQLAGWQLGLSSYLRLDPQEEPVPRIVLGGNRKPKN